MNDIILHENKFSILDKREEGIDFLTIQKRISAKESSSEAVKNEVKTPTQKRYSAVHKLYKQFCSELKINSIQDDPQKTAELVHSFISSSILHKNIKPQTVSVYLAALSRYFKDHYKINPMKFSVLDEIKKSAINISNHDPKPKTALTINHVIEMIDRCDIATLRGLRDRAILSFGFCSGCRRSEIARLSTNEMKEDIDNNGYEIRIQTKTGFKTKEVMALDGINLRKYIREWKIAANITEGHLFFKVDKFGHVIKYDRQVEYKRIKNKHMSGQEVKNIIKKYSQGIDESIESFDVAAHSLRSGVATTLLNAGASLKSVQDLLAHEDGKMTMHYHQIKKGFKDHAGHALKNKIIKETK